MTRHTNNPRQLCYSGHLVQTSLLQSITMLRKAVYGTDSVRTNDSACSMLTTLKRTWYITGSAIDRPVDQDRHGVTHRLSYLTPSKTVLRVFSASLDRTCKDQASSMFFACSPRFRWSPSITYSGLAQFIRRNLKVKGQLSTYGHWLSRISPQFLISWVQYPEKTGARGYY